MGYIEELMDTWGVDRDTAERHAEFEAETARRDQAMYDIKTSLTDTAFIDTLEED